MLLTHGDNSRHGWLQETLINMTEVTKIMALSFYHIIKKQDDTMFGLVEFAKRNVERHPAVTAVF